MSALLDRARLTGEPDVTGEPDDDQLGGLAELDPDPEPGRRSRRRNRERPAAASTPRRSSSRVSNDQIRKQIAEEIDMYTRMLALAWSMSDPECATVLSDQSTKIATELAKVAVRSDWLVEHYQTAGLFGEIAKVLHALFPVGRAIFAHHIARRGADDGEGVERVTVATEYGGAAAPGGVTYAPFRPAYA